MKCPIYQVDAFTDKPFSGNPAAICILDSWPATDLLQSIGMENNLSETAFLVRTSSPNTWEIRWFTPTVEVALCGHATLASAHVLYQTGALPGNETIQFLTRKKGPLSVCQKENLLWMNFPAHPGKPRLIDNTLQGIFGRSIISVVEADDLLVVVDKEETVRQFDPEQNRNVLTSISDRGVILTAKASDTAIDFVSRFFAPHVGILEDPVTGSAHCTSAPFWASVLGKTELVARQVSSRGGDIFCHVLDDRVHLGGQAVTIISGELSA